MRSRILRIVKAQSGATAIEYALIAALVAVTIISGTNSIGVQTGMAISKTSSTLSNANTASSLPSVPTPPYYDEH